MLHSYAVQIKSTMTSKAGSSLRLVRLKPQGPGLRRDPDRPVRRNFSTTLDPKISREKYCGFLKFNI